MAPYANSIGATPASLTSIAVYLANTKHAHHRDYELTPIQVLGAQSVQEFIDYAKATFETNRKKSKAGRPPKNGGNWIIVRTPDGTHLEPHEMAAYEQTAVEAAGHGGPVVGILAWHRNIYSGADDLNLLSAAFTSDGHMVRDRDSHTIKNLRWLMDQTTDRLNEIRREKGIPLILTMSEIKRERAKERGEPDVIEQLARLPKRPRTVEDIEPALLSLGCEITRFAPFKDSISFKAPKQKKAKKFRISSLLESIEALFSKQEVAKKSPQVPEKGHTADEPAKAEIVAPSVAKKAEASAPTIKQPRQQGSAAPAQPRKKSRKDPEIGSI